MTKIGRKVTRWLRSQSRMKQTVRELSALSDRELSDIGVARCDIYRVARGVVR
jgi:uncharacterized protein YjiS (DUF1127 family)